MIFGFKHSSMSELFTYIFPQGPILVMAFAIAWLLLCAYVVYVIISMIKVDARVDQLQEKVNAKLNRETG